MSWGWGLEEITHRYEHIDRDDHVEAEDFLVLLEEFKNLKLAFYELERLHYRQLEEEKQQ